MNYPWLKWISALPEICPQLFLHLEMFAALHQWLRRLPLTAVYLVLPMVSAFSFHVPFSRRIYSSANFMLCVCSIQASRNLFLVVLLTHPSPLSSNRTYAELLHQQKYRIHSLSERCHFARTSLRQKWNLVYIVNVIICNKMHINYNLFKTLLSYS